MNDFLPIGVCVLPERRFNSARTVTYPGYVFEILNHAGLFHQKLALNELEAALEHLRILVTVGDAEFPEALKARLSRWVEGGGAWLCVSGTCGMEALLGVTSQEPEIRSWGGGARSLGEGYLVLLEHSHAALAHVKRPLHFFGGATVIAKGAKVLARVDGKHGQPTDRPGILEHRAGKGRAMLIAPNLTGTVVRIQQGIGVTRDGIPAADGTGAVDDLVLKADDGAVLDWDFDRDVVPEMGGPDDSSSPGQYRAFLEPIADIWREILLRTIFHLARELAVDLAVLWLYPRKLPALAHMSHDSDSNEHEKAEDLLRLLDEQKLKTTWCIILPGYDAALTNKIKAAGHELATHYDAIGEGSGPGDSSPGCAWSEVDWRRQHRALSEQFGELPVTNKNHGTRWEGDVEFFEWCVNAGIELDQTKSPSKTGECGFTFGTCHPYFPVTYRGKIINCLELCTHIWDMPAWAPVQVFEPLLTSVKRRHGILHQLYHPFHTVKPEVADSLRMSVRRAREEGLEWWTARQINAWERARRTVRVERWAREGDDLSITLRSAHALADATVLRLENRPAAFADFIAWGFTFTAAVESIDADRPIEFRFNGQGAGRHEK